MRSGFKMKGMDFGNSPVTKKGGPETKKFNVDNEQKAKAKPKKITSQDEESAYENAQNDYDTDNPTKAQLAKALQAIKNERSNKKRSDAERALEAKEDAMGL
tara:strand:+ start:254 stop:559 length:306 start_codon:yes stop_codon:yes gene_type:complete